MVATLTTNQIRLIKQHPKCAVAALKETAHSEPAGSNVHEAIKVAVKADPLAVLAVLRKKSTRDADQFQTALADNLMTPTGEDTSYSKSLRNTPRIQAAQAGFMRASAELTRLQQTGAPASQIQRAEKRLAAAGRAELRATMATPLGEKGKAARLATQTEMDRLAAQRAQASMNKLGSEKPSLLGDDPRQKQAIKDTIAAVTTPAGYDRLVNPYATQPAATTPSPTAVAIAQPVRSHGRTYHHPGTEIVRVASRASHNGRGKVN